MHSDKKLIHILYYYPVVIRKTFGQLMLYFHWLKRPWPRANIRCSPWPRKTMALFVSIDEREKQKPLQQRHFIEAIATKLLLNDVLFSYLHIFLIFVYISLRFRSVLGNIVQCLIVLLSHQGYIYYFPNEAICYIYMLHLSYNVAFISA